MPFSQQELRIAEALEERYRARIESDPDSDDYDEVVGKLATIGAKLDEHYKSQRQVDDTGKLTADATTRQPARVGEGDSSYFFEPNVREVQAFFRRNPDALDRLRDSRGAPLRAWAEGEGQAEMRAPMYDGHTQALTGYNVIPAKTHLDLLNEDQEPYKVAADEMWRLASEDATKKGGAIKRYRDVKLDRNEWKDYIEGGIKRGLNRILAPASLGAADAMSAGQASPLYDAVGDLADYRQARMSPEAKETARAMGYNPSDAEDMASSEDIQNRSMPAYVAGNIAGYGAPGNPANIAQRVIQEGLGYSARGVLGRAGTAAVAGGVSNAVESVYGDMARNANEGEPITAGNIGDMALNAAASGAIGTVSGGLFDLAGQGIGSAREGFRRYERNAPLRTLEEAGGRADVVTGVAAPTEIQQAYNQMHSVDPNRPPTTAGGELAADLAPHIEQSVKKRAIDEQARTAAEMENYYNHPDYQDIRVSAKPAVEGMIEMAQRNMGRNSTTGSIIPMDPATVDQIGGILRDYSEAVPVTRAEGPSLAQNSGGTIVPGELANRLYGYKEGDIGYFAPGQDALVLPIDVNAQNLTTLEQRIDRELNFAAARGNNNDPVWNRFNERVKAMRDEFPAYKDADGNLVAPPPDSVRPEPFDLAADVPRPPTDGRYLAPPMDVGGPTPPKPEGLMGVGPGGPPIPENPFDPRLPTSREAINPQPAPIAVQGDVSEPGYIGPEALPGVGPRYNPRDVGPAMRGQRPIEVAGGEYAQPPMVSRPDIPGAGPNYQPPNDPRRLGPPVEVQGQFDMGGEYGPPQSLDPGARQGVGPYRRFEQYQSVQPQPTQSVQGTYNQPPEVQMERAPTTERNPYGFASRGEPPHETPLPPSYRERSDELAAAGMDEKLHQREYGKTPPIEPRADQNISPEERALQQHDIDEFLRKDKEMNEPRAPEAPTGKQYGVVDRSDGGMREKTFDTAQEAKAEAKRLNDKFKSKGRFKVKGVDAPAASRSPLEKSLDAQLDGPDAPPVPKTEIEEAGARQTADREQVAQNQKAYVEDLFAPGREARAAQVEQVRALAENPQIIEEAIEAVKKVDERLGPIDPEQKRTMVVSMIEKKLGRKIDAEDLIRFGLISAGLVQMSTSDDDTGGAVGAGILGLGLGRGKKGSEPEAPKGPSKPAKPTQPEATLEDGRVVRGFSAMRNQQHTRQEAIEKAMKRLGVEGDNTLESRIRTYGQLDDRGKIDKALLDEAKSIDKASELRGEATDRVGELRRAAGAHAYPGLRDRSWPGGSSRSLGNAIIDMLGVRGYRAGEYLSGRFNHEFERNPFIRGNDTTSSRMQQELLQEPARRLLNLTGGGPAARLGGEQIYELLKGDSVYESKEEYEKKQKQKRNKERHP